MAAAGPAAGRRRGDQGLARQHGRARVFGGRAEGWTYPAGVYAPGGAAEGLGGVASGDR